MDWLTFVRPYSAPGRFREGRPLHGTWHASSINRDVLPPDPRFKMGRCASLVEALEQRALLTAFNLYIAAPQSFANQSQMQISLWSTGQPVSGNYTGDGSTPSSVTPLTGVTPAYHTYNVVQMGIYYPITATATSTIGTPATASYALQFPFGNYPASNGGATVYIPNTSPQSSVSSNGYAVAVDTTTSFTYVAETYTLSSGALQFGITRLTSNGTPDTSFGQLVSGTTHTGTYVVPSFGGGADVPYAAALLNSGGYEELAVAGSSTHGFAVAIVDISGAGSTVGTRDYNGQTMPSGNANAVMFDSSFNVIAAGQSNNQFTAVQLYGVGSLAGEKVSGFGTSGVATISNSSFSQSVTQSDPFAITADQAPGSNDLVLGGWAGTGTEPTWCDLAVAGIHDDTGQLDTTGFGSGGTCMVSVRTAACNNGVNGFNGCRGNCSVSHDSVYSLAWDDDLGAAGELVAIGGTDYSGTSQIAIWELSGSGSPDTTFGPSGVEVPNVNAIDRGGTVDQFDLVNGTNGYIYAVGSTTTPTPDLLVARINPTTGALDSGTGGTGFGTGGYFMLDLGASTTNSYDVGRSVAIQTDGSVVAAGYTGTTQNGGKVAVARFLQFNAMLVTQSGLSPMTVPAGAPSTAPFSPGPLIANGDEGSIDSAAGASPLDAIVTGSKRRVARHSVHSPAPSP